MKNHEYWIQFSGDYNISIDARFPNFGEALAFCDLFMDLYPGHIRIESLTKMKDYEKIKNEALHKHLAKVALKSKAKPKVSALKTNIISMQDYSNRQDRE